MILILETLLETNGKADEKLFGTNSPLGVVVSNPTSSVYLAAKLKRWVKSGFPELGDFCGMGLGGTTASVIYQENFLAVSLLVCFPLAGSHLCSLSSITIESSRSG